MWEVRRIDPTLGVSSSWRASDYSVLLGKRKTLKAANRLAERYDQAYGAKCTWVCWVTLGE